MARVQGVPARICTWELVTGFGQNPTEEELADFFHRDFPDAEQLPKFWKLLSFNSSEGRRHRYLVILAEQGDLPCGRLLRGHRILPRALFLYARADEPRVDFAIGPRNGATAIPWQALGLGKGSVIWMNSCDGTPCFPVCRLLSTAPLNILRGVSMTRRENRPCSFRGRRRIRSGRVCILNP